MFFIGFLNNKISQYHNKNFSDICLTDYCRMHTLIYRVNEFFTTTLDECDLDVKIYDNIKNRNEDISFYELN